MYLVVGFFAYIIAQIFFFNNLIISDYANPKVFICYLLFFPLSFPKWADYLIMFLMGIILDVSIQDPVGAFSFSLLCIAAIRRSWIALITPQMGVENLSELVVADQTFIWQLTYIIPLILVFETVFNILAVFDFTLITVLKIFSSTLYTLFWCAIVAILFYKKQDK